MTGGMGMRDEEGTRPRRGGIGRRGKRIKKIRRSERNGKSGDNAVARALWNVIAAAGTLTGMTEGGTEAETGIGIGETGIVTGTGSGTTRGAPAVGAEAETKGGAAPAGPGLMMTTVEVAGRVAVGATVRTTAAMCRASGLTHAALHLMLPSAQAWAFTTSARRRLSPSSGLEPRPSHLHQQLWTLQRPFVGYRSSSLRRVSWCCSSKQHLRPPQRARRNVRCMWVTLRWA
mmetsp:Transcript_29750/g.53308  ORF Transcript_29750/g.53308 Transcript_29750/m.53308 type:complete len:231 (-) Transcript_29750:1655-2347(-)